MQKLCAATGKAFDVTDEELAILKKFSLPIPPPSLCPSERHRRRMAHRNERKIYKDVCDISGKPIISIYSPDKAFKVLAPNVWWGDSWDAKAYGQDFDFNRPFFEQFYELQLAVPHIALINVNGENSDYCNITTGNKNCYLVFGGDFNQDCMYSCFSMHGVDNCDVYWVLGSELMYDCVDCENCYNVKYSRSSVGCRDGAFLFECRNCQNCFGCVGLVGKKYHILNKPHPEEEYKRLVARYNLRSWKAVQQMKTEFEKFRLQFPHRYAQIINAENCTGDYISNSRNCTNCFSVEGPAEDCKDVFLAGWGIKDCLSSDHFGYKAELYYEMLGSLEGRDCAFCAFSWTSQATYYCDNVVNSHDLFGCSNIKRAEYCILNKQYTKEEYKKLVTRVIEHMKKTEEWGEFFPIQYSKFAYNETVAQDYFPLSKEEALAKGYKWLDEERHPGNGPKAPDTIEETTDAILNETLECKKTGRPYKIIPQELAFYRKMGVPVPHYASETRNEMRIALRNPIQTWSRQCANCGKGIETSYSPDRPERVYCERCYLAHIY